MTMFSRVRKTLRRKFSISINEYANICTHRWCGKC